MLEPNQAQTKARELISVMFPSVPPMNRLFKFQLKLFISGAYKSKTKNGFVAFMRIIDLQKEIHYSLIHSCCV